MAANMARHRRLSPQEAWPLVCRSYGEEVVQNVSTIVLIRTSITECIGVTGGAISSTGSAIDVSLIDTTISDCTALVTGGAILVEPFPIFSMVRRSPLFECPACLPPRLPVACFPALRIPLSFYRSPHICCAGAQHHQRL